MYVFVLICTSKYTELTRKYIRYVLPKEYAQYIKNGFLFPNDTFSAHRPVMVTNIASVHKILVNFLLLC